MATLRSRASAAERSIDTCSSVSARMPVASTTTAIIESMSVKPATLRGVFGVMWVAISVRRPVGPGARQAGEAVVRRRFVERLHERRQVDDVHRAVDLSAAFHHERAVDLRTAAARLEFRATAAGADATGEVRARVAQEHDAEEANAGVHLDVAVDDQDDRIVGRADLAGQRIAAAARTLDPDDAGTV